MAKTTKVTVITLAKPGSDLIITETDNVIRWQYVPHDDTPLTVVHREDGEQKSILTD